MMWQRFGARYRRGLKRYKKSEDGVTAIEFAMIGGPFLYLLAATFEIGLMLFAEYVIENGTANASRQIRTGEVQTNGVTASDFKQIVCGNIDAFLDCQNRLYVDVRSFTDFSSVPDPIPPAISSDSEGTISSASQFDPGEALEVVIVRVYYDWKLFTPNIPGLGQLSNLAGGRRLLSASAAFRNEPFGS